RKEHALDDNFDILEAQDTILTINKNITFTRERIEILKNTLNYLIGNGPEDYLDIEPIASFDSLSLPLPKSLSADLLSRRPDLMAQIWRVEAAAHLVGAAKADFYPNVDLSALAGLDSV